MTYIEQWHIRFKLKKIKVHQKNMSAQFIWPSNQLLWQSNEYIKKKKVLVKTINLTNVTKQSNNNINHQFHPLYSLTISELLTCH